MIRHGSSYIERSKVDRKNSLIGIVIIILGIALLFSWEKWGKYELLYEKIAVLNEDVMPGTIITDKFISSKAYEKRDENQIKYESFKSLIGKVSIQKIYKNTPLYDDFFIDNDMRADETRDRHILSIPDEWIESCSRNLCVRSIANFYFDGSYITKAMVVSSKKDAGGFDIIASGEQIQELSSIAQNGGEFIIAYD